MKTKYICLLFILFFLLIFMFFSKVAYALVMPLNTSQLVKNSDLVIEGKVKETKSSWDEDKKFINTYVQVEVTNIFKGKINENIIMIKVPGGKVGNDELVVSDFPEIEDGEKAVFYLRYCDVNIYQLVGANHGVVKIKKNGSIVGNISLNNYICNIKKFVKKNNLIESNFTEIKKFPKEKIRKLNFFNPYAIINKYSISGWTSMFNDNFESKFPHKPWETNYWGRTSFKRHSGSYSLWCAAALVDPKYYYYPSGLESWLVGGPFSIRDAHEATLEFWRNMTIYDAEDKLTIAFSDNGEYFYKHLVSQGQTNGWKKMNIDLTNVSHLGNLLGSDFFYIAFIFESDSDNRVNNGVFIDDLSININYDSTAPFIDSVTPDWVSAGTNQQITIKGNNFGSSGDVYFYSNYMSVIHEVVASSVISWTNNKIVCIVPEGACSGTVYVDISTGKSSNHKPIEVTFGSFNGYFWEDLSLPVNYYINSAGTADTKDEFNGIQKGFQTWQNVASSYIDFSYQHTTSKEALNLDGTNVISWDYLGDPTIVALTAILYSSGKALKEVDIIFNSDHKWADSGSATAYDVQSIAAHEIGHFLGLDDLYGKKDFNKTMFGWIPTNDTRLRSLESGDMEGATYIYPQTKNLSQMVYIPNVTKQYYGWTTPYIIQNQGSIKDYLLTIMYDHQGRYASSKGDNIKSGASLSFNPNKFQELKKSTKGSAIAYSNSPMGVIVNEHSPTSSMAFESFTGGGTKVYLPNITKNYFGWTTPIITQNIDTAEADLLIEYYSGPTLVHSQSYAGLKPGSSLGINPSNISGLGSKFQGSAVVTSTNGKNIVCVVNEQEKDEAMSYSGFVNGSKEVFLPNITKNYYGWNTPFVIQNIGDLTTDVDIMFYNPDGSEVKAAHKTVTIPAKSMYGLNPAKVIALGGAFNGAVKVISNSQDIVSICNEHSVADAMAYSGISFGNPKCYLPNITRKYFGWSTPFVVQNLSSESTFINVSFYNNSGFLTKQIINQEIPSNVSKGFNPDNYNDLGSNFKGSVVIESSGQEIATIVNEHHSSGQAMSYNGF